MDILSPAMDLEKELTCSICADLLYQPLTLLDCLHTFCGACLKEWFGWQAQFAETRPSPPPAGTPIFTCPSCRDAVRSTKHNATVVTLLDMLLTSQPDKCRTDAEKAEMDSKYRPGDNVFPTVHLPRLTAEELRIQQAERRLIDEVREISRQEAVAAAMGDDNNNAARETRRRQRRAALASTGTNASGTESASDEDGRLAINRSRDRRRHRSASQYTTAAAASNLTEEHIPHIIGHQSSLGSLISSSQYGSSGSSGAVDIEREIEAFARQIQEEGILDGLDLDNIDLINDDELSRRIADAYQRRQRGRGRHESSRHDASLRDGSSRRDTSRHEGIRSEGGRHRTASAVSHRSHVSVSNASAQNVSQTERSSARSTLAVSSATTGRPPSSSSRTSSRQRSQSQSSHRSRASTASARPPISVLADGVTPAPLSVPSLTASRPPLSNAISNHLEVRDGTRQQHQRRRTASEGRSYTMSPSTSALTLNHSVAHSQTELPLRPAELGSVSGSSAELLSTPPVALETVTRSRAHSSDGRNASYPAPSASPSNSCLINDGGSPTTTSFQARATAMGLPLPSNPQSTEQNPSRLVAPSNDAVEENRPHEEQSADVRSPPSGADAQLPRESAADTVAVNESPPPSITSANFASSPVVIDTYELPAISIGTGSNSQLQEPHPQHNHSRQGSTLYPEPDISCARCHRHHIEYDLHYNCSVCSNGNWNICLDCFRAGKGCQHWFGFGYAAWNKWEKMAARWRAENAAIVASGAVYPKPHMLTANRYLMPRIVPGGAEGRRTLTTEDPTDRLQSGVFCARCSAWANSCYWRCEVCNEGDWGFCNDCVNQGFACTHPLLPLTHEPIAAAQSPPRRHPDQPQTHPLPSPPPRPAASALFRAPGDLPAETVSSRLAAASVSSKSAALRIGSFRTLTFTITCELCHKPISPTRARFHCYCCTSTFISGSHPGDYDICQECYSDLEPKMGAENGSGGWRRCPSGGHRMVVVAFHEDGKHNGAPRRIILENLVGGFRLETEPADTTAEGLELELWYVWYKEKRHFERLVSRNAYMSAPSPPSSAAAAATVAAPSVPFPPGGGVGRTAVARWAYYPEPGRNGSDDDGPATASDDEIMFPRWAEIREIEDVNDEWYHGVYMGRKGLFPSGFVKMLDNDAHVE
ncbi:hypothetical protein SEPCBS57363_005773 [Sporothrix epigloea]|uniref:RING-type domain-containing protein n=1 Tax=Sporothrix epigloea TaxID=1892477 RepID=A0ABP0DZE6_9PEZI